MGAIIYAQPPSSRQPYVLDEPKLNALRAIRLPQEGRNRSFKDKPLLLNGLLHVWFGASKLNAKRPNCTSMAYVMYVPNEQPLLLNLRIFSLLRNARLGELATSPRADYFNNPTNVLFHYTLVRKQYPHKGYKLGGKSSIVNTTRVSDGQHSQKQLSTQESIN
ncbi:hypothetical protein CLF_104330, partial [Clonorchis sinensis]